MTRSENGTPDDAAKASAEKPWMAWLGRSQSMTDVFVADRAAALHAALDLDGPPPQIGDALPPLWHWMYFWEPVAAHKLGRDGHPALGGFLPPVPLDRRMWAGSRISFHRPLRVGAEVERRSTITAINEKTGRTGRLAFVTVKHEFFADGEPVLTDEHDIVYREPAQPGESKPAGVTSDLTPEAVRRENVFTPDPVLLFRYSALTLNGHRIHYDHPYATGVEGYAGLVVHGPLLATLMAAAAAEDGPLSHFEFRGRRPVICGTPIRVAVADDPDDAGRRQLRVIDHEGFVASSAVATITPA